jgi:micrococcal nuclease
MWNYRASLVRVIDGDTVELKVDLGFRVYSQETFRLARINTPERGQPGYMEASQRLEHLLTNDVDYLDITTRKGDKQDKYGRYLVEITAVTKAGPMFLVNSVMLAEGLAVPYDGGKR